MVLIGPAWSCAMFSPVGVEAHTMSKEKARVIYQEIMTKTFGGLGIANGFVHVDVAKPGEDLPRKGARPGTWSY
jgi:hypothetical protein